MDDTAVGSEFEESSSMVLPAYQTHPMLGHLTGLREELGPALAELSTRQRQVLSLLYLAGLDETEVSEALGMSVKAVRKCTARGIAALRVRGVVRECNLLLG